MLGLSKLIHVKYTDSYQAPGDSQATITRCWEGKKKSRQTRLLNPALTKRLSFPGEERHKSQNTAIGKNHRERGDVSQCRLLGRRDISAEA